VSESGVHTYDIAVSFAGEQREYVERTVTAAKALGLRVFYDLDEMVDLWGKNVLVEQRRIYRSRARFVVPFISADYLAKPYPRDEFDAAMMTAVRHGDEYILPVLMGEVVVPPELLNPHVVYLKSDNHTPHQLATRLKSKVDRATRAGQEPRDVASVVREAFGPPASATAPPVSTALRMPMPKPPKKAPFAFDGDAEADRFHGYLAERFRKAAPQLGSAGFPCDVRFVEDLLIVSIETGGRQVYTLRVARRNGSLEFHHGASRPSGRTAATVAPISVRGSDEVKLSVMDYTLLTGFGARRILTQEEFFDRLWNRVIDLIEEA
jgi:hypothetical protein